jgi:hypothetical protein
MTQREIIETLGALGPKFARVAKGESTLVTLEAGKQHLFVCINRVPISEWRKGKWRSMGPVAVGNGVSAQFDVVNVNDSPSSAHATASPSMISVVSLR